MPFIFYAKAAFSALVLSYVYSHNFVNIRADIEVMDCINGVTIYHTQYYKYTSNGIEFLDDKDGQIKSINNKDSGSAAFILQAPEVTAGTH